ncbi:FecR family protein [Flavivirga amylovorans]|uniref:FecR family protein n=1 Tax=Flavivirga amylovorans TaxID=870486 RepID=A0ABT8X131_9FLAO|nr:FecR family protein [Flavivirga amylovorans]MDO5987620.1 FecR family protein [Flavivirga amylovorans]
MKYLIYKVLNRTITDAELRELQKWLEDSQNQITLENYIRDNYDINLSQSKANIDEAFAGVIKRIEETSMPLKKIPLYKRSVFKYAAAAVIAILISLPLLIKNNTQKVNHEPIIVNNTIKKGTDKATLTLEDGTDITLVKDQSYVTDNIKSDGTKIIYEKTNSVKTEIAYNYLTVPRGGQYYVKLSDGTKVWLNSESKLKYPTNFISGALRKVELIYGEAYFDVSPSSEHDGAKFSVITDNQELEVLGTEFNIKAYKYEAYIYSTLVEGKVNIVNGASSTSLSPNQQAIIKQNTSGIEVVNVDTFSAISWKEGIFSFEDMPLDKIMKVLARWYDFNVIFVDPTLKDILFTGILRKNQSIKEILEIIRTINNITYEINNDTIIFR